MELKRTPLYDIHASSGARLIGFAGWEMPVQYTGVIEEHLNVRKGCALFDVSHMGEVVISGPGALEAVQLISTNDAAPLREGQCRYTLLCYPDGGIVDDCVLYCFGPEKFLYCVNASNTDKVYDWIKENVSQIAETQNLSSSYAQIALQGPASVHVLKGLSSSDPSGIKRYHFITASVAGIETIVSRTGYTGEDGFELYMDPSKAEALWNALMESGKPYGLAPAGLGARDTLRLEMGYPLYGRELTEKTTPMEAGLHRFVNLEKEDFIGKGALEKQKTRGVEKRLVGFEMTGQGIPRQNYAILSQGRQAGTVTSGTLSPSLKRAIGMGYVQAALNKPGTEIEIKIRNRSVSAEVVKTPFYKRKTSGKPRSAGAA